MDYSRENYVVKEGGREGGKVKREQGKKEREAK